MGIFGSIGKFFSGAGGAIASGVGGIVGGLINKNAQKKTNEANERFSREMFDKQNERDIAFWNMQNAYNDPSAQMQRFKDAGLNPNLVYGSGTNATSGPIATHSAPSVDRKAPQLDLGGVVTNALMARQIQSNIARTEAETKSIDARTAGTEFQNQLNNSIGVQKMADRYAWASDKVAIESQRANADWEAYKTGAFEGRTFDDPNSPVAKAAKAGFQRSIQELENAKKLGDIRGFESVIKNFEASLAKQGIPPNTPWYYKIVGELLQKVLGSFGTSVGSFLR